MSKRQELEKAIRGHEESITALRGELEKLRLRIESMSLKHRMPLPETGDYVWVVERTGTLDVYVFSICWTAAWPQGRVHPTEEAAREWKGKYWEAWSTP